MEEKKDNSGTWILIGCIIFGLIIAAAWIFQLINLEDPFK